MIKGKKVLGVILARIGSKGVKQKNIREVCGHPLISYSIYAGLKSRYIDELVVSTDSKKIAKISENYGAKVPFLRPKKLALDHIWSRDALKHAVLKAEEKFKTKFDFIVELPATAPMRPFYAIDRALEKLHKSKNDSVIGVYRIYDKHPVRIKKIINNKLVDYNRLLKEGEGSRRQELPACYSRNGSIYSMKRSVIIEKFTRLGKFVTPEIMSSTHSINIDEIEDLYLFETMVKKGLCENKPASIFINKQIHIKNKNQLKTILVTYNELIFKDLFKQKFKNYKILFCDQKNLSNIKNKDQIISWLCSTKGIDKINRKNLDLFKNLKILASPSTGLTHIDIRYLKKRKIKLLYLDNKTYNKTITSSSEFALALIFSTLRNIPYAKDIVASNNWRNLENKMRENEINEYNFGIFGFGRIGKNIFKSLKKITNKINYFDPYVATDLNFKEYKISSFLKKTNFLIISSSLNDKTESFFNLDRLIKLRKNSIIVNIARGELVDEKAIVKLIKNNHILKYSTDVLSNESEILNKKNSLIELSRTNKNIIISPHIAGLTYQSEKKAAEYVLKKMKNTIIKQL